MLGRQGHKRRPADYCVACNEGDPVDDARRGDDLVGGIGPKIQLGRGTGHGHIDRPRVDATQSPNHLQFDTAQLDKLREFPEDDGRHRPPLTRKYLPLVSIQFSTKSADQNVRVEIQHSASQRIPVDMMSPLISILSRRLPIRLAESW